MLIELLIVCPDLEAGAATAALLESAGDGPGIVCTVIDAARATAAAGRCRPHVLLLDVDDSWQKAFRVLEQVLTTNPTARSLLAYGSCTHQEVADAIRHGASGCVLRTVSPQVLAKAVRTVHEGGTWYCRGALLEALQAQLGTRCARPVPEEGRLTRREEEILRLIGQGLTNKEIGRRLDISDHTVKTHLHRVYSKLNQSGRYKAFVAQLTGKEAPGLGPALRGPLTALGPLEPD